MIQDPRFTSTYFVLDGIEQFTTRHCLTLDGPVDVMTDDPTRKLSELRLLIATTVRLSQKVKWLLGVECKLHDTKPTFVNDHRQICLTLDESRYNVLSEIAQEYAALEVTNMCNRLGYSDNIRKGLTELFKRANGNFMFIKIALDIVGASTSPWNALYTFRDLAADELSIRGLYHWNYKSTCILELPHKDSDYCRGVLYAAAAAHRPLSISELIAIIQLPPEVSPLLIIQKLLPAFLEVREDKVYFKHLSASIFIRDKMGEKQLRLEHSKIARQCLKLLLRRLHCSHIETSNNEKTPETEFGLTTILWVKHLSELGGNDPKTVALAVHLLSVHLIDWLDLLIEEGLILDVSYMMTELNAALELNALKDFDDEASSIIQIVREATTFIMWKASSKEERQSEEGSAEMSPEQRLLFAADLPLLRKNLLPAIFPGLQEAPILDNTNDSAVCLHVLKHGDWVRDCTFSPNGRTIASASDDRDVRVWDVRTGNLQHILGRFTRYALGVSISSAKVLKGGQNIDVIAAFERHQIKVWEAATGNLLKTLDKSQSEINADLQGIALSQAADMLAAAVGDNVVIWQLPDAIEPRVLKGESDKPVIRVIFSPDGKLLASTADTEITIWSTTSDIGDVVCTLPPRETPGEDHIPNQGGLGESEASLDHEAAVIEQRGHMDEIEGLCFSPDSKFLVSGSDDRTARVWDIARKQTVAILEYHDNRINDVCFSPDGNWIATGSSDHTVALWKHKSPGNWGSGESRKKPDHVLRGHNGSVLSVSFSPLGSGNLLASTSTDGDVRIWDLNKISGMMGAGQSTDASTCTSKGHNSAVSCVAISHDGRTIASASYDGVVCCWDGQTGTRQRTSQQSHSGEVLSMTFSSDGQLLVTASVDRTAFVWEVTGSATTPLIPRLRLEHSDWVRNAQFDLQGRLVATGGDEGIVRVYDVSGARTAVATTIDEVCSPPSTTTQKAMKILDKHNDYVFGVAFSSDSKRLASGGDDAHVMVWDLDSDGKEDPLHDMTSPKIESRISDVEFSADGTTVVSISSDGTIAVWTPGATGNLCCQIIQQDEGSGPSMFMSMRIDPRFPEVLLTELGAKCYKRQGSEPESEPRASWRPPGWLPLRVDKDEGSISYDRTFSAKKGETASSDGATTIYLPSDFTPTDEPYSCRIQGGMVVVGSVSGHVLIFRFSAVEPDGKTEERIFGSRVNAELLSSLDIVTEAVVQPS
ncbi:WD40-repeat-containing domain protein [Trichoderma chlorosporum]